MTLTELIQRFARLESQLAHEKGDFTFFALFMREEVPDRWDLIVAAPWIDGDKWGAVSYLIGEIKSRLGEQELTRLSRIVPVDTNDAALQNLNRAIQIEHGNVEVRDSSFFGLPIKYAYIITSKRPPAAVAR